MRIFQRSVKNVKLESEISMKFFFIKIFMILYCNVNTFRIIHNKWKYIFRSFPQSLDDSKHVLIHSMNIKIFSKKKDSSKFLTQIWSFPRSQYVAISPLANFECQKKFWDIFFKNRLSTHNMVISLELEAKKNTFECPFEIIGFICQQDFNQYTWNLRHLTNQDSARRYPCV